MADGSGFLEELKRRHVWRVVVAYAVVAWLVVQLASIVFPAFGAPAWVLKIIIALLVIVFPIVVVWAWIYELAPGGGIRRTAPADSPQAREAHDTRSVGRKLNAVIIVVLVLAVILLLGNEFVWHKGMRAAAPVALRTAQPVPRSAAPVAPAHAASSALANAMPLPSTTAAIPQKSVAVLPFVNDSGAKDQQFFSDGLSEDLITALSQFAGLKVISRESAFQFRNSKDSSAKIGRLLGVAHLLEGSVQRAGDEVRITATLVDASDGTVVWTQHYDKPYKDLFTLQDDITHSVAGALKAKLLTTPGAVVQSDRPPSGNLDAYAALQHGNAYMDLGTEAGCRAAIAAYERAIRLDPRYAVAYAGLSSAWQNLASAFLSGDPQKQAHEKEKAAVDTALKLNPDSSRAHRAHANLLMIAMDWRGAEAEFQRAARLAPNDAGALGSLATVVAALGHNQRAVDLTRQSLAINPRNAVGYTNLSGYLAALGHLDAARTAIDTAIALQPGATDQHATLAMIEIQAGNAKAALAAAQKEPPGAWHDIAITLALQIGPDKKAADAALRTLVAKYAPNGPYQIAEVYALRGDADNTFKWLDRAYANHDGGIAYLLSDPFILRYRNDPRFAAFCRKVGLPTTTDAVAMK